jgi:hypothetical protein
MRVHALAERHRIGVIDPVPHLTPAALELYRAWIDATYLVVDMANALRVDHGRPAGPPPTPLALRHRSAVHGRFLANYVDAVTRDTAGDLWRRTLRGVAVDRRPRVNAPAEG